MTKPKLIDFVKLVSTPSKDNGYFYVVNGPKGTHYVSALFGRAAQGLTIGTKLKLSYTTPNKAIGAYILERV